MAAYEGLVATRNAVPSTLTAGNKYFNSRSGHVATSDIASIKLLLANYYVSGTVPAESGPGAAATMTAAIEYPAGVFTQVPFGGMSSATVANIDHVFSDSVSIPGGIPSGATFWVRRWYSNTGGILYHNGIRNAGLGDLVNASATVLTDLTMGGTIAHNAGNVCAPPMAIIGQTEAASAIIVGDSIGWGFGDTQAADFRQGVVAKAFPSTLAFCNISSGGARANNFQTQGAKRLALLPYCSHAIIELGTNDIFVSGASAATLQSSIEALIALLPTRAKAIVCTISQKTTSTDSWATLANQTVVAGNTNRVTYNTAVRAGGLAGQNGGFFELVAPIENSLNDSKWIVNGTAGYATADGVHHTAAAYTLASGGVDTSRFTMDAPPTLTSASTKAGQVGAALSYTITATGTAPITYGVSGALPSGVTFDGTATISGTPTTAGVRAVTITATNSAGEDSDTLTFTIAAAPPTGDEEIIPGEVVRNAADTILLVGEDRVLLLPLIPGEEVYDAAGTLLLVGEVKGSPPPEKN